MQAKIYFRYSFTSGYLPSYEANRDILEPMLLEMLEASLGCAAQKLHAAAVRDSSLELYGYCVKPASAVAADLLFDAKGAVDEALGSNPSLLQVLGGLVDVELSTSLAACPVVEGVADSVEIDTKCLPVECSHGYILEKSECRRPAEEEGEGMRSGILAGLVFGCIAGTTVLLGAIYIIARRRRSAFYDIGPGHV
ncbi:hypothetical protein DIPPA_01699 [Diplonema papillatum]|nr:hypothetical protein DIPPA_01699 [Diplonema papillatum]